jgi:multiple sugar transport system ATP-binding protein
MSTIDVHNVWKIYPRGNVVGVKDLSFSCRDKEFLAILGPSGGGKSSTLRMLAGLEEISKGEIQFDGTVVNNLGPAERNIALAFESYALYQRLSVYENIAFPLRARKLKETEVDQKVMFIADLLDLTSILNKYPPELAGGHQQRVSLARAFVRKPNVTLLDEPISHMDQRVRAQLRARIRHLHDDLGLTTVYVTHDQAEAISLADRIAIINKAELQQIGTIGEIWNQPTNRFVAYFVGEPAMNFIPGELVDQHHVAISAAQDRSVFEFIGRMETKPVDSAVTIGVRPQQIKVSRTEPSTPGVAATVKIVEFQGETTVLTVALADRVKSEVKVEISSAEKVAMGNKIWLHFAPNIIHLFDGETPLLQRQIE